MDDYQELDMVELTRDMTCDYPWEDDVPAPLLSKGLKGTIVEMHGPKPPFRLCTHYGVEIFDENWGSIGIVMVTADDIKLNKKFTPPPPLPNAPSQ